MVFRLFAAALAAGMLAAVLITGLQGFITTPMILEAEKYEFSALSHEHNHGAPQAHEHGATEDAGHDAEWMPADGAERTFYSLLANAGAGIGFALLIVVGLSFNNEAASASRGILWAAAGFCVFTLSPALGLPPGAPGMPTPDERAAQLWWVVTVLLSGGGLAAMVFGKNIIVKAVGPVLMAAPHIWGAPPLMSVESALPVELAARFSAASIVLSAVFWSLIGIFSGLFYARLGHDA